MTTVHRHRAGQAIPDDGSCWRSLGERQNCTAATFHDSRPPLDHTGSAHLIGEGSDPKPGEWVKVYERQESGSFAHGLATGFVAAIAVVGAIVMVLA